MKSGAQRKPLLVILGILLVGAGIGLNIMLPRLLGQAAPAAPGTTTSAPTASVVVTATAVTAGTKLDAASNIAIAQVPVNNVPADAVTTLAKAEGQYVTVALPPNTIITPELLVASSTAVNQLTFTPLPIPSGSVLFVIDFDPKTMSYFVVGDHVDILAANATGTTTFSITNLKISAIGNPSEQGKAGVPTTISLVVTRAQATQIGNLLSGANGDHIVRWLLRSPADNSGA